MSSTEIFFDPVTQAQKIVITLNHVADGKVFDAIHDAFEAAGKKFVEDNIEKILSELKTENIEKYVAEYVAKNLELKIKEKDNA